MIAQELTRQRITLPQETETVVKRVIHTTADFDYLENLPFTPGAVPKDLETLRSGRAVIIDTQYGKGRGQQVSFAWISGSRVLRPRVERAAVL